MVEAGLRTEALAELVGVSRVTVSNWRNGAIPDDHRMPVLLKAFEDRGVKIPAELKRGGRGREATPLSDFRPGWPEGWQARTYRLALEAAEKGATEEEIAVVRGWMMDPQLQLLWSGGAPPDDRMKELDGIEIGARAWLRARGRMVKPR